MKRVLIIDDEPEGASLVADLLKGHFEPRICYSGREGLRVAVRENPDLIILDLHMAEMDGYEVCKKLREQPSTRLIPVILLTHYSSLDEKVRGFESGADDYITKPYEGRELVARSLARVRRFEQGQSGEREIALGNLRLEPKSFQVWVDDEAIHLTQMEFELIRYFLEHPNVVVGRAKLLGDLWPDAVVTDRTVDTHIANLRKKIRKFRYPLTTIYGAGYILKVDEGFRS
jgi:DNA-binding response OmpR family regulator